MTMPAYEISVDGKPKKVELTKEGERSFTARVDGKPAIIRLRTEQIILEKKFSLSIDGREYEVELLGADLDKPFQVKVDGAVFKTELKTPVAAGALPAFAPTLPTLARKIARKDQVAEGAVTAPMTGKIVSVKVKKGDQVKTNQVLCIIEAMKMENEISSSKAGIVQEVIVAQGSSVSEGDVLLIIG
jgi:biotin carboxyl carrier protein